MSILNIKVHTEGQRFINNRRVSKIKPVQVDCREGKVFTGKLLTPRFAPAALSSEGM